MADIKGFLIDLDGVLYVESRAIEGAAESITWLREHDHPFRFITNTTMRSRAALVEKLHGFGIVAEPNEIFSTCVVAAHWLKARGFERLHLLLPDEPKKDFSGFELSDDAADAVVVGDLGEGFDFATLNRAFRLIKNGAKLVGLQKNRYWQTLDGLSLDVGPFVAALEYAAETEADIIGKPSRAYFETAVNDMNLASEKTAMIGDDLDTDIFGGQQAGLKTILVKSGKTDAEILKASKVKPDWVFDSIADLPEWLQS